MCEEIIADARALIDGNEAVENRVAADVGIFANKAVRPDVSAGADCGGFRDERCRMETRLVARRLVKEFDGVSEGEVRIGSTQGSEPGQAGVAFDVDAFFEKNCRGACGFQERKVAPVGEKSDLACLGMFDAGDAVYGSLARAFETTAKFLRNFRKLHGHKNSSLPLGASLA